MGRLIVNSHPRPARRAPSLADLDLGSWSAEEELAFEAAEWVLGVLIARTSAASAAEQGKPVPDQARLTALAEERSGYAAERRGLSIHDPTHVEQVLQRYSALARRTLGHSGKIRTGGPTGSATS